mmetsp:Transcript_20942/g.37405  ORF Transcript_20942/g.37405 Transcript_20942/m.37405 type:complete len:86 (-) Transcript_20942:31-288(-)
MHRFSLLHWLWHILHQSVHGGRSLQGANWTEPAVVSGGCFATPSKLAWITRRRSELDDVRTATMSHPPGPVCTLPLFVLCNWTQW